MARGAGPQRCKVGTSVGLGESLTPNNPPIRHVGEVLALLLLCPKSNEGGPDPIDIHVLRTPRLSVFPHDLGDDLLAPRSGALPAVLVGPARDEEARFSKPAAELPGLRTPLRAAEAARRTVPSLGQILRHKFFELPSELDVRLGPTELHRYRSGDWRTRARAVSMPVHSPRLAMTSSLHNIAY